MEERKQLFAFALAAVVAMVLVSLSPMLPGALASDASGIRIDGLRARVDIDSSYATTNVQVKFTNPTGDPADETFVFQIPDDAFISNFSLTVKGTTFYAKVMKVQDAQAAYKNAQSVGNNAGLLASRGRSTFEYGVNIASLESVIVALRYEQFIARTPQGFSYSLPLSSYVGRTIGSTDVSVDLSYDRPIKNLTVGTYKDITNTTFGDNALSASAHFETTDLKVTDDYNVAWDLAPLPVNGNMLFYEKDGEGYFFHVFNPGAQELGGYMPKDIVFVLDHSGSMQGQKIDQLKQAFRSIIWDLQGSDYFSIITFSTSVTPMYDNLIPANDKNKKDAEESINSLQSDSSTNINQALLDAEEMLKGDEERVPIIVFLTDGLPTAGTTDTKKIRQNVLNANSKGIRIYCLGFGNDVDMEFLKALALENKGYAKKIYVDKDAGTQITGFYDTISLPLLRDLSVTYSNGTYDVFPAHVDTVYDGSDVVICGKLKGGVTTVTFHATAMSASGSRTFDGDFTVNASPDNAFIARYWAYAKIRDLNDKITVEKDGSAKAALVDQVTNMSLQNSFVTQYTSLFVEIPKDVTAGQPGAGTTTVTSKSGGGQTNNGYPSPSTGVKKNSMAPGFEEVLVLPALALIALAISWKRRER